MVVIPVVGNELSGHSDLYFQTHQRSSGEIQDQLARMQQGRPEGCGGKPPGPMINLADQVGTSQCTCGAPATNWSQCRDAIVDGETQSMDDGDDDSMLMILRLRSDRENRS